MKVAIRLLKKRKYFYKVHSDLVDQLASEMSIEGQLYPITITRGNVVIDGWHRYYAAKQLGWTHLECKRL